MSTLHAALRELASSFSAQVMDAIRRASLEELVQEGSAGPRQPRRGRGRPRATNPRVNAARNASGRLARRTPEEIGKAVDKIVLLVKTHKDGMRAEDLRKTLGLQPKEMPRILKDGLSRKKLKAKGQKRATTYFAA